MVSTVRHSMVTGKGIVFNESKTVKRYCKGIGIEFGAAAHNPFGLENCINVAPIEDFELFKDEQVQWCGHYAHIDIIGDADNLPFKDHSFDYIVSSHVIEHMPNIIAAFKEWNRILKFNGTIAIIFPKRDALPEDKNREITSIDHFFGDYKNAIDVNSHDGVRRGHYHIFTLQSMLELIYKADLNWKILEAEETDDKVGNGHMIVVCHDVGLLSKIKRQIKKMVCR